MWRRVLLLLAVGACVDLTPPAVSIPGDAATGGADVIVAGVDADTGVVGVDAHIQVAGADGPADQADPVDVGGVEAGDTGSPPPVLKDNGQACAAAGDCTSGRCVDQVCCDGPCSGLCESCKQPGQVGKCSPVGAGTDPDNECGAASCSNGVETLARTCTGSSSCSAAVMRACAPNLCAAAACAAGCTSPSECAAGSACIGGTCVSATGLQIYWSFDEATGLVASDSSGQNRHGTYGGSGASTPTPSTMLPGLQFPNPRSRAFSAFAHTEVRARNIPAGLRPANNVTIAAWFRVTNFGFSGYGDVISVADAWTLYMSRNQVLFTKRAFSSYVNASASSGNHDDGNWHHVAGVSTSAGGMVLYIDGMMRATNPSSSPAVYSQTEDFLVGADLNPNTGLYFGGNIDEVRYYTRALSAAEIAALAAGGR